MGTVTQTNHFTMLKFNGANWNEYKENVLDVAFALNLLQVIEPPATKVGSVDEDKQEGEINQNSTSKHSNSDTTATVAAEVRRFWLLLTESLTTEAKAIMRPAERGNIAMAWKLLREHYESDSKASMRSLMAAWLQTVQGNSTATIFIDEIMKRKERVMTALQSSVEPWEDVITQMVLLQGLDSRYDILKQHLFVTDCDLKETILQIQRHTEVLKLEAANQSSSSSTSAHATHTQSERPYCTYCQRQGHTDENCFKKHPALLKNRNWNDRQHSKEDKDVVKRHGWTVKDTRELHQANMVRENNGDYTDFEIDSGASHHYKNDMKGLINFDPNNKHTVSIADKTEIETKGCGEICGKLQEVHFIPEFSNSLLSVAELNDQRISVMFHPDHGTTLYHVDERQLLAKGERIGNSFHLIVNHEKTITEIPLVTSTTLVSETPSAASTSNQTCHTAKSTNELLLLHKRLGHVSSGRLHQYLSTHDTEYGTPTYSEIIGATNCITCKLNRAKERPHKDQFGVKHSTNPYEYLHFDIKHVEEESYNGSKYALIIVDDYTRMKHVYTLKTKDEVLNSLKHFYKEHIDKYGYCLKYMRCDKAKENVNAAVKQFCDQLKVTMIPTETYMSEGNGVAERAIQLLQYAARTIRAGAGLPEKAWAEAYHTAAFLENYLPTSANRGRSPIEVLRREQADIKFMKAIGAVAYVHNRKPNRSNLEPTAKLGVLIGYNAERKLYRIMTNIDTGAIEETSDVTFDEIISTETIKGTTPVDTSASTKSWLLDKSTNDAIDKVPTYLQIARTTLKSKETNKTIKTVTTAAAVPMLQPAESITNGLVGHDECSESTVASNSAFASIPSNLEIESTISNSIPVGMLDEPLQKALVPNITKGNVIMDGLRRTSRNSKPNGKIFNEYTAYVARSEVTRYKVVSKEPAYCESMLKELQELHNEGVFRLVDLPEDKKVISSTWVHKEKQDDKGNTYIKSRLCPRGFEQIKHTDYDPEKLAAPTILLATTLLMFALESSNNMVSRTLDIKGAFRIPKLNEEVYLEIPQGMKQIEGKALLLNNSLYGLKQAAYNWHQELCALLEKNDYMKSKIDGCLYYKQKDDKLTLIGIYVDDIRVLADTLEDLNATDEIISAEFPVQYKDQNKYLGINIQHYEDCLTLDQVEAIKSY